jgi:hypothetical protein
MDEKLLFNCRELHFFCLTEYLDAADFKNGAYC